MSEVTARIEEKYNECNEFLDKTKSIIISSFVSKDAKFNNKNNLHFSRLFFLKITISQNQYPQCIQGHNVLTIVLQFVMKQISKSSISKSKCQSAILTNLSDRVLRIVFTNDCTNYQRNYFLNDQFPNTRCLLICYSSLYDSDIEGST